MNERPNYSRAQYDLLQARLHRLAQQPVVPVAERARLAGKIDGARQWLAPSRGAKLQRLWDAIRWDGLDADRGAPGPH